MPSTSESFVDLARVSFAYPASRGFLSRLRRSRDFNPAVISGANLALPAGQALTIFGQEGSGKSTFLRLLSGVLRPTDGRLRVNGQRPFQNPLSAAGYISPDESLPSLDTVSEALSAFGHTHRIPHLPARIGEISEQLQLDALMNRPISTLSLNQRLRVKLARAALSEAPLILADDVADHFGVDETKYLLADPLARRTVIVTTRRPQIAEGLGLPLLILHKAKLLEPGTQRELTERLACPLSLDAWIEGVRYDLIRQLKRTPGIKIAELHGCNSFGGQRLRLELLSSRYLPTAYDLLSRQPLIKVQEYPASLTDILSRL